MGHRNFQEDELTTKTTKTSTTPSEEKSDDEQQLANDLGPYDVLCGRHKAALNNIGNRRLRVTVSMFLDRFTAARDRKEKGLYIDAVLRSIEANGGRFLAWSAAEKSYLPINRKRAYDKCSHLFRDMALSASRGNKRASERQQAVAAPLPTYFPMASLARSDSGASYQSAHNDMNFDHVTTSQPVDDLEPLDFTETAPAVDETFGADIFEDHSTPVAIESHTPTMGVTIEGLFNSNNESEDKEQRMLLDLLHDIAWDATA